MPTTTLNRPHSSTTATPKCPIEYYRAPADPDPTGAVAVTPETEAEMRWFESDPEAYTRLVARVGTHGSVIDGDDYLNRAHT